MRAFLQEFLCFGHRKKEPGCNTDKHCGEFEPDLDPERLGQCWSVINYRRGKTEPMS